MRVQIYPLRDLPAAVLHAWRDLAARAAEPNPFAEPALAIPAAVSLRTSEEPVLLTVSSPQQMIFASPMVERSRFRRVPLRNVATWRPEHAGSAVPLVDPDGAHDAWAAVVAYASEPPRTLVLDDVAIHGGAVEPLRDVLRAQGRRIYEYNVFDRPVVRKRSDATYLEGRISSQHMKKLRRQRRGLEAELGGPVAAEDLLASATNADDAVEAFLALESKGWKGKKGTALANDPGESGFFREACRSLHEERRLQMWRLGTPERAAALACNFLAGDAVVHFRVAYDEDFSRLSPGTQLELEMLDRFHNDERLHLLDSCTGADNELMNQLYPDRSTMAILLVPPPVLTDRLSVALLPRANNAFRRARRLAARLRGREAPADYGIRK